MMNFSKSKDKIIERRLDLEKEIKTQEFEKKAKKDWESNGMVFFTDELKELVSNEIDNEASFCQNIHAYIEMEESETESRVDFIPSFAFRCSTEFRFSIPFSRECACSKYTCCKGRIFVNSHELGEAEIVPMDVPKIHFQYDSKYKDCRDCMIPIWGE